MKVFVVPEIEVKTFEVENIIATSGDPYETPIS